MKKESTGGEREVGPEKERGMSKRVDLDLSKQDKSAKSKKEVSTSGLNPKEHSQATLQSFLLRGVEGDG